MNAPVWKRNEKSVSVAVWENEGKKRSVSIRKTYKTKDGQWRVSNTYFREEIETLIEMLQEALAELK